MEQLSFGREFDITPRHRLFFGIWPDAAAIGCLTRLMRRLRSDELMLGRPVDSDRLHVTLHHLGDFVDQIPPSLVPAATAAAATVRMQPFDVVFDRVGGTRGQFLLRACDGSTALKLFRQTLSAALTKAGLRRRVDPAFNPHMTLSYDFSDVPEQSIDPIQWTVRQFVLIESLLGKHRHIERGCWPIRR
jgi:2'-5' RNA ligase